MRGFIGRDTSHCMVRASLPVVIIVSGSEVFAGPISSVTVLGTTFVIINDKDVAFDLLDKRSTVYSSRPVLTFAGGM